MPLGQAVGPGTARTLLFVSPGHLERPLAFSTAELSTADPTEAATTGGIKRVFGNFWGFQEGMAPRQCPRDRSGSVVQTRGPRADGLACLADARGDRCTSMLPRPAGLRQPHRISRSVPRPPGSQRSCGPRRVGDRVVCAAEKSARSVTILWLRASRTEWPSGACWRADARGCLPFTAGRCLVAAAGGPSGEPRASSCDEFGGAQSSR
jgi:hypothetical protein